MASALLASFPVASSITNGSYALRASRNKNEKLRKECVIMKLSPKNNLKHRHFKDIEMMRSNCDKYERKYIMNATSAESYESEPQTHHVSKGMILKSIKDAFDVFCKFSRPYASIATILCSASSSLLAVEKLSDISPIFFIGLSQHAAAFYFMLIYHIGLNELVDVEIDKINKPHLALASGKHSFKIAVFICALSLFMSLGIGWIAGSKPMLCGLLACFALGTAYSANLPLLRWKRFSSLAMVYSFAHPMISANITPFLHMKTHVLKRAAIFPRSMIFNIAIMGAYYAVIGLAKDIPDIEGDKAGGIQTFAIQFGAKRVFWFCVSLLEIAYGAGIVLGITSPFLWNKIVMVLAHSIKALVLWYTAKSIDLKSKASTQSFYMTIFILHCVEAIIVALAR